jgi:hypothetical protein
MLTDQDFINAAASIGCRPAAIKAVAMQEGAQNGFYPNGKVIIKFEGHVFHHFTQGRYDQLHPSISYPMYTEKYAQYGQLLAYVRFNQAFELDQHAAMMATSWGMFQIMGENFSSCGFKSVDDFITAMHKGEPEQLLAFVDYVKDQGLAHYLVNMALPGQALLMAGAFALRYNGSAYRSNHYDVNIANYFMKFN